MSPYIAKIRTTQRLKYACDETMRLPSSGKGIQNSYFCADLSTIIQNYAYTKTSVILGAILLTLLLLLAPQIAQTTLAQGPICRVNDDVATAGSGDTWATAYAYLQDALAQGTCTEIWVAAGVYYPDEGVGKTDNDQDASFALTDKVQIYGGFAGTETSRDERNWETHVTVLSGDIGKDDVADANHVITSTENIMGTNATHVVTSTNATAATVLDGVTITGGAAGEYQGSCQYACGGGMFNQKSSPTLTNINLSANKAGYGGGIYNEESSPTLTNINFSANMSGSNGHGGGMYNTDSYPMLTNVTFSANNAGYHGGGMYN